MIPWQSAEFDEHEQVCCFVEPRAGLRAIVAIHSTALGPAAGGTRFRSYARDRDALDDALRLSRAMSYKCALAGVPLGGGKAVILGDPMRLKNRALLQAYGHFLNRVGGQFCTGEDVGFSLADCEVVREVSPYIVGTTSAGAGDPARYTAQGVFYGLRAVLEHGFQVSDYQGVHFSIQGLGSVGWRLCGLLHEAGARLTVTDLDGDIASRASRRFGATIVAPDLIHRTRADVFVPCALGGVINRNTIDAIQVRAIAGAANNQLASTEIGETLRQRHILYAPDFVINAGGVIGATEELSRIPGRVFGGPLAPLDDRLRGIYSRLREIFARAEASQSTPEATALHMACELIGR